MHAYETLVSKMTLAELAQRTGLSVTTIVERVHYSTPQEVQAARKPQTKAPPSTKVDVRTPAGRAAYDKVVLEVITNYDGEMNAEEVRRACGGTPAQLRGALTRLVERKLLKRKGQARGTKYRATPKGHSAAKQSPKAKAKAKTPPSPPSKGGLDDTGVTVLKYLRKRNAIVTTHEIALTLGATNGFVNNILDKLLSKGFITNKSRRDNTPGYVITEAGKKAY